MRGLAMIKFLAVLMFLFSSNANAACTPVPDCVSIGYTETSCEGGSLKCPFDTSKLKCIPCDSSFRYDCRGDNISGGIGATCSGKYVTCECSPGAIFNNGECICDNSCKSGAIYYSDGTCSSCVDESKTAIGIMLKENELIVSLTVANVVWGDSTDVNGLSNTRAGVDGKSNTSVIVSEHTSNGLTSSNSAAIYCNSYSTVNTTAGDWYLPTASELYDNLYSNNIKAVWNKVGTPISQSNFWSSCEYGSNGAYRVDLNDGHIGWWYKNAAYSVACFLEI